MTLNAMVKKLAFYHKGWMPLQGSKWRDVVSPLCLGGAVQAWQDREQKRSCKWLRQRTKAMAQARVTRRDGIQDCLRRAY